MPPRPATNCPTPSASTSAASQAPVWTSSSSRASDATSSGFTGGADGAGDRPGAVAPPQRAGDPALRSSASVARPRQAAPQHDRLVGAEVRIAEVGDRRSRLDGPDRGDREVPRPHLRRRAVARPAGRRRSGRAGYRGACARSRAMSTSRPRARMTSPSRTTPAWRTGSPRPERDDELGRTVARDRPSSAAGRRRGSRRAGRGRRARAARDDRGTRRGPRRSEPAGERPHDGGTSQPTPRRRRRPAFLSRRSRRASAAS